MQEPLNSLAKAAGIELQCADETKTCPYWKKNPASVLR